MILVMATAAATHRTDRSAHSSAGTGGREKSACSAAELPLRAVSPAMKAAAFAEAVTEVSSAAERNQKKLTLLRLSK